jgi:hypothetical protein
MLLPELRQLLRQPEVYEVLGRLPAQQWPVAGEVFLTTVLAARDIRCERQRIAKTRQRRADNAFPGLTAAMRQVMADMPDSAGNSDYLKAIVSRWAPRCEIDLERIRKAKSRIRRSRPKCSGVH